MPYSPTPERETIFFGHWFDRRSFVRWLHRSRRASVRYGAVREELLNALQPLENVYELNEQVSIPAGTELLGDSVPGMSESFTRLYGILTSPGNQRQAGSDQQVADLGQDAERSWATLIPTLIRMTGEPQYRFDQKRFDSREWFNWKADTATSSTTTTRTG
jgi:hypothetical protein